MQRYIERQPKLLLIDSKQLFKYDQMPGAAYRQKFREPLYESKNNTLQDFHTGSISTLTFSAPAAIGLLGASKPGSAPSSLFLADFLAEFFFLSAFL